MSAQSQSLITVVIDGQPCGTWDTCTGGETTAEITKRRPGGMPQQRATRARPVHGDLTITRGYDRERDVELARRLRSRVGRATIVITEQPLDDDDVAWGKPTVSTGILQSVNTGDVDSDSDEERMIELVAAITAVN